MFALFGVGLQAAKPIPETTRRDFLGYSATALFYSGIGLLGGGVLSLQKKRELNNLNQNAMYLDNTHKRIYRRP